MVPFNPAIRSAMDHLIDHVNVNILQKRGYQPMPTFLYQFYQKTDEEILQAFRRKNEKIFKQIQKNGQKGNETNIN